MWITISLSAKLLVDPTSKLSGPSNESIAMSELVMLQTSELPQPSRPAMQMMELHDHSSVAVRGAQQAA